MAVEFYVFVCVAIACVSAQAQVPRVTTTEGVVVGTLIPDGNYFGYFGLYYGGTTAGANRFKAPTDPPKYPGDYHATSANVICAQPSERGLIGEENCLTLNIFTNNTSSTKPVVVWLNGEEYATTTSQNRLSFKRFIQENIVVVNINYRLSIFGFLCLKVEQAPGNAGLKDVIQGLKWIKNNIAGFGGDPNNVVLIGHGSGAAMVDLITMSPSSKDLVHKAIALSGSALAPWAISYNPQSIAKNLGDRMGYTDKTNEELALLLQKTDINILISSINSFEQSYNNTALFAPCIEDPKVSSINTFLADAPINILRSGNYSHVPFIAGYTNVEGTTRARQALYNGWLLKMQENFTAFLPVDIDYDTIPNRTALAKSIQEFYFGNKAIDMDTIQDYLIYHGDTLTLVSVIKAAKERASTSKSDVRLLEFAYKGTYNSDWPYTTIPLIGVKHGGILNYIFDFDLKPNDGTVRNALMTRIFTFINTGTPRGVCNTSPDWPAINTSSLNYLYYSDEDTHIANLAALYVEETRFNPHKQRMDFWNDIYSKYYKSPVTSAASCISVSLMLTAFLFIVQWLRL